ncbi:MAG: carboxymuconolactone decarboxylase family protein [Lewinella sp.]|nr:carboxymuconolactone decarboxylase family protein [Lewinella sp.]
MYQAFSRIPGAMASMWDNKRHQRIDPTFVEHLQLAVTEVNGCAACSYAHAHLALQQGMSQEEINGFLTGDAAFVPAAEARAILFAQHFAEARGRPSPVAYAAIVEEYGPHKAAIILAAVQFMLVGNMYGLPFSALQSRFKGKSFADSSLWYECTMLLGGVLVLPVALVHGLLRHILGTTARSPVGKSNRR